MQSSTDGVELPVEAAAPPTESVPANRSTAAAQPPATASLPSLAPLSLAFTSSLYDADCRDSSLPASESGLLAFRDALFEHCSSQHLRLSRAQLGPQSATTLSRCMLHSDELSDVREVVANGNALRSFGLVQLLKAVARPDSRLHTLELRDNGIGNSGARELAKVLVNNTTVSTKQRQTTFAPSHTQKRQSLTC